MKKLDYKKVKEFFSKDNNIIAAYLFGSRAVGVAREDSDFDIAVLMENVPDEAINYRIERAMELEKILGKEVDLIILNNSSYILQFQVIKEGKIIYEKDADKRAIYQMHFLSRYYDYIRFFDFHSRYLCNEIKEGGLGVGYKSNRS
ncbi:MAG: putative nucleotidyltransferase [Clostridiales bacterium]|jgi:hypothetical protein|nr:putative nucleotidyltransferase [Clostridiales bacterium]